MKLVQLTSTPPAFRGVCNAEQLEVWALNKWRFIDVIVCMWCLVADNFLRDVQFLLGEIEIILIQESRWRTANFRTLALCWALGTGQLGDSSFVPRSSQPSCKRRKQDWVWEGSSRRLLFLWKNLLLCFGLLNYMLVAFAEVEQSPDPYHLCVPGSW